MMMMVSDILTVQCSADRMKLDSDYYSLVCDLKKSRENCQNSQMTSDIKRGNKLANLPGQGKGEILSQ